MSDDFEKRVDEDIAAGRHRWVRWTCLVPFAALPASFALEAGGMADSLGGSLASVTLTLAGLITGIMALLSPYARNIWRPFWTSRAPALDERERAVIARAHARAFEILLGSILAAFLYAWLAMREGWWLPRDGEDLLGLLRTTLLPLVVLPVALAEWSLPPPPDDSED